MNQANNPNQGGQQSLVSPINSRARAASSRAAASTSRVSRAANASNRDVDLSDPSPSWHDDLQGLDLIRLHRHRLRSRCRFADVVMGLGRER